jgi:hypothetical protein
MDANLKVKMVAVVAAMFFSFFCENTTAEHKSRDRVLVQFHSLYCNGWYWHGAHGCCYGNRKPLDMGMVCVFSQIAFVAAEPLAVTLMQTK